MQNARLPWPAGATAAVHVPISVKADCTALACPTTNVHNPTSSQGKDTAYHHNAPTPTCPTPSNDPTIAVYVTAYHCKQQPPCNMPIALLQCTGSCSIYGICLTTANSAGSTYNTAPTISLVITAAAPATTSIKYGYTYTACGPSQQPAPEAECELGATARDAQNGDLTSAVLVCSPSSCTSAACIAGESSHCMLCFTQACCGSAHHNAALKNERGFSLRMYWLYPGCKT